MSGLASWTHRVREAAREADLREMILGPYLRKWVILGVLIGVVAGVGAIVFYVAIDLASQEFLGRIVGYTAPRPRGEGETAYVPALRPWLIPVVTTVGG